MYCPDRAKQSAAFCRRSDRQESIEGGFAGPDHDGQSSRASDPVNDQLPFCRGAASGRPISRSLLRRRQLFREIVASLSARGTCAVIVITAGFGEGGSAEGAELRRRTLEAAKPCLVRILGPIRPRIRSPPAKGINASFSHPRRHGNWLVALISQSGALVTAAIDWANARGFGFSG